jgi:hypothetical protein
MHATKDSVLPRTVVELAAVAAAYPLQRKLLVCRHTGVGRELLRTLALSGTSWVNFEVSTPRLLANELVLADLTRQGLTIADEFDELAMLDTAIDEVLADASGRLAELAEGTGLRQAVANSVRALRAAGIGAPQLERARFRDEDKRGQIARILDAYERRLREQQRIDGAGVLARAAASLAVGDARLEPGPVLLMPGQSTRGLAGQLLDLLLERGARVLPADPVFGMAAPAAWLVGALPEPADALAGGVSPLSWLHDPGGWSRAAEAGSADRAAATERGSAAAEPDADDAGDVVLDLFAATSVSAELREVMRRVLAAGLHWDEVEIVATDAVVYGVALDGLARRLGIRVSYATGLPVARTRPGRAVAKYLEWVEQGFPADVLRQMLERGDVAARDGAVSGTALARRLRLLKVGRDRARYDAALLRRERSLDAAQAADDERTPEEFAEDRARERDEIAALAGIVRPLLAASPAVAPRAAAQPSFAAPAELARGLLVLLAMVPATTSVDRTAKRRLEAKLKRIESSLTRVTTLSGAIAVLTSRLRDAVPAPDADGGSPWTSAGGHLHLSDLEHGGHAGRRATFIVGLDSGRFPGGGGTDALLVDDDRRRLTGGQPTPALPTSSERTDERRHAFAALVARLRGRVTFSHATWDAVEGRAVAPAAELLQAYRLQSGDATADYEALHRAVSPAASAVPRASALLDVDDVWLHALARPDNGAHNTGALRRGIDTVCGAYPQLAAGVGAWKARLRSRTGTPYHGVIAPRPGLDPRAATRAVSPTQLQVLGTCPHRYLLRYVLRLKKPDDPQLSVEQWLSPLERGSLMHEVYERALRQATTQPLDVESGSFGDLVIDILHDRIEQMKELLPPPGGAVLDAEVEGLHQDARAFVEMVREDARAGRHFIEFERKFGRDGAEPVEVVLPDTRTLRLAGAIDRIDRHPDGGLVVVDYKTGSSFRFGGKSGVYDGGRRLQHVLYAKAAERLLGADVAAVEYHFPTRRSENHRARYDRQDLRDGMAIVADLLEFVANGWFVPSNVADDCRFCDYAAACRVSVDPYGKVTSPLAEWSREVEGEAADLMRRVRR